MLKQCTKHSVEQIRVMVLAAALLAFALCRAQHVVDSTWDDAVRTVTLYRSGIDQEPPLLLLGGDDRLVLSFDLLADEPSLFRYTLHHCDAEWNIDELEPYEYVTGFDEGTIADYRQSFTTLQLYYHYEAVVPAVGTAFLVSGNYALKVHPEDAPDSTVLTWRFRVSEELLNTQMEVVRPTSGVGIYENQEVNAYLEPKSDLVFGEYMPFQFVPHYLKLYLQQNGREDNVHNLAFQGYGGTKLCYRWGDANIFAGGNSFRYFDLSNLRSAMYNVQNVETYGGETYAIIRPCEDRSGKHYEAREGLNGGMKVNIWDRRDPQVEADYVWVNLSLPMERPYLNGSIHVVGALTQWQLDDRSRMEWRPEYKAYTARLLLKQGYYSYQLLFLPAGEREGLTATLEGDHNETPNGYSLYVYYRSPADRYDRLLGVRRLQ